jgi:hypothetical protein
VIGCEFEFYESEASTVRCRHDATHTVTTLCCGQVTYVCARCLDLIGGTKFWRCNGCGVTLGTPFAYNRRPIPYRNEAAP